MQTLRLTLIQSNLIWQNISENLNKFETKLNDLSGMTDVVVLPEMFTTGFSMDTSLAEEQDGQAVTWMKDQSYKIDATLIGSIIVKEQNKCYNRLYVVQPDGSVNYYDKRHLFTYGNEHKHFQPGQKRLEIEIKSWKICPLICYDLRFPVWSRNTTGYDLLLFVANWPGVRTFAWKTLLAARAIENQCYVAGVNRIGVDGKGLVYDGNTMCLDYLGRTLATCEDQETVVTVVLDKHAQDTFRQDFPALNDQDHFSMV